MKIKEIVEEYNVDALDFERFLIRKNLPYKSKFSGIVVDDDVIDEYIHAFLEYEETQKLPKVKEEIAYQNEPIENDNVNIEAMEFCPYCGKKLMNGAVFCAYCGHSIPVSTTPVTSNGTPTAVDNNSNSKQESEDASQAPTNKKRAIIIVVSIVIVIAMLVSLFDNQNAVVGTWIGSVNSNLGIPYTMELTINKGGTCSIILALSREGASYDGDITDRGIGEWWVEGSKLYVRQYGQSSIEPWVFVIGLGELQFGTGRNAPVFKKAR